MQHLTTRLKKAIVVGALCLTCLGVLTSFQVAQAHGRIPTGCTETSHIHQCKICAIRNWRFVGRQYEKITWRCPDGSHGRYQHWGPCGKCRP